MKKLLVMDNDGCLVDSVMEALVTAYNSLLVIEPETNILGGNKFTAKEFLSKAAKTKYSTIANEFRNMRPFIRSAEDYGFILKAIGQFRNAATQEEFDALVKELKLDVIKYEKEFYKAREELQIDYDSWYKLTPGYEGVVRGIKKLLEGGYDLAVATTNSRPAIKDMFQEKYLGFPIDEENIADKDIGKVVNEATGEVKICKADQLVYLAERNNVPFGNMIFVDDQISHLEAVGMSEIATCNPPASDCGKRAISEHAQEYAPPFRAAVLDNSATGKEHSKVSDVKCVLAGYGYTTPAQRDKAVSLGMPVVIRDIDFYSVIRSV